MSLTLAKKFVLLVKKLLNEVPGEYEKIPVLVVLKPEQTF